MIPAAVRVFICTEAIDMRQGVDRLVQLVRSRLGEKLQTGSPFAFGNCSDAAQGAVVL
jgi:hypothetical protein